jgi:aspartate racemase
MIQRFEGHAPSPLPIGIVGGMGPYAGYDLVRKIFRWTKAGSDEEHLPLMLHSFPAWIPGRPAFLLGEIAENPGEDIGSVMVQLARCGAKVLGMPCNTAHSPSILSVALNRLEASGEKARFISIIDSAVSHVRTLLPHGGRVGLLGTIATLRTRLYQNALEQAGIIAVVPDADECASVQHAISNPDFGIKSFSDPVSPKARKILFEAALRLIEKKNVSVILLGCTEIPLAITETSIENIPVVDATSVLAREMVRASCPERLKDISEPQLSRSDL